MRQAQYDIHNANNDKTQIDHEVKECLMSKERVNLDIRTVTPSTVNVRTLKLRN